MAGAIQQSDREEAFQFLKGIGRALGGALVFSLPILMTMEMWWLGFYVDRLRLVLLLVLNIPLLIFLSYYGGFERTRRLREDVRDAVIAYGLGIATGAAALTLFGIITVSMPPDEIIGKIAIEAVPASIGALLGRSQFGAGSAREESGSEGARYLSELFLMAVGALYLGLTVAPTEEMVLISYKMTPWHAIALIAVSLLVMQGFVFAVEFSGTASLPPNTPWWGAFMRFTVVGYCIALGISVYVLWTFGRTDGAAFAQIVMAGVVLGFPAAVGAAAARLIL